MAIPPDRLPENRPRLSQEPTTETLTRLDQSIGKLAMRMGLTDDQVETCKSWFKKELWRMLNENPQASVL